MADSSIDWPTLLREFRKSKGLKQEAAAEHLGVSQATISRWESGAIAPTVAMRNKLFRALRRERSPIDTLHWVATFRRLLCPGAVSSEARVIQAVTGVLADELGAPRDELEGLRIADVFHGEPLEIVERIREEGAYRGRVLSFEAVARFEVDANIRRGMQFNCHYIGWPHFADSGDIVFVNQGAFISDAEADAARERLGEPVRLALAA